MRKQFAWLVVVFLVAAGLRLAAIGQIPPGLTHDEADHGLDAWGVVNGIRPIYFTVGYGREPLFDYSTAVLMSFLGPTYLAGRITAVFFSLLMIAGSYAWVSRAFNRRTALLTAAGLAVSFWPLMTGRQSLRSITLAAIFTLAAYFFWLGLDKSKSLALAAAGLLVGLSFYTYIPSRILWAVFPAVLLYLAVANRSLLARVWRQTGLMLLAAAVVGLPLFQYLAAHPEAEVRLEQLSAPLAAAQAGDFRPLLENTAAGLKILTFEGDHQWRYNLPGKPLLSPAVGLLFYGGLGIALWWAVRFGQERQKKGAPAFFALVWLAAGLSPVLVTGPELSTTQAIGIQPVLFLFPALALDRLLQFEAARRFWPVVPLFFGLLFVGTINDYFLRWANAPEVRVQYETSLATAVDYLNSYGEGAAAISTTTPDRFHSPAAGQLLLNNPAVALRWFNGLHSLLIPQSGEMARLVFSGFAPLDPSLAEYAADFRPATTLPMRETDLDRPLTVYEVNGQAWLRENSGRFESRILSPDNLAGPLWFGQAAEFLGYELQTPSAGPGEELGLVTLWRVGQALPDGVLFSQLLDAEGRPVAQADRLDAPSYYWVPGDVFLQLHRLVLPATLADGPYSLIIGLYTRSDERRVPVVTPGVGVVDHLVLQTLEVKK